ncbi:MAG TPA: sigma-70 family RNA polymerase sigma factor [Thermoanaerobaculia bacterium]|nr:sigma-70 family RNA polymerase sigma factor [Thermoanaerobaculia bacterium]
MRPGSAEELADLVARAGPRLKRIAARFCIPADEAEDLLQDAWLATVREWEQLENPEAWLTRTVFFLCCIHFRKRRRRQWLQLMDGCLLEALAPLRRPPQERADLIRDLIAVCALLSQRERLLLHLRYGLGLTGAETAERLGCRPASVGKLTERAVARARQAAG